MKILIIPDTHGKLEVYKKAEPFFDQVDHIVHLGDYVDSEDPNCPIEQMLECFRQWLALKEENPDKVTLLVGNHEFAYLHPWRYQVTKHRRELEPHLTPYLGDHKDTFQMAWEHGNWLFTHAGLAMDFFLKYKDLFDQGQGDNISSRLNYLYKTQQEIFWRDNSPIWIREELLGDSFIGVNQIFGHTPQTEVREIQDNGHRLIFADTWHYDQDKLKQGILAPMGTQSLIILKNDTLEII